jgi:hypothetical protein
MLLLYLDLAVTISIKKMQSRSELTDSTKTSIFKSAKQDMHLVVVVVVVFLGPAFVLDDVSLDKSLPCASCLSKNNYRLRLITVKRIC